MDGLSQILYTVSYLALPLMLAIVAHEYAHGWVADRFGDTTARLQGRLTMNPLAHIDIFGTIIFPALCLLAGGFLLAWAKPVPINSSQLRRPRRDMAMVAAAGPAMNLMIAIASALLFAVLFYVDRSLPAQMNDGNPAGWQDGLGMFLVPLAVMAKYSVMINVVLMVFNLIPIPPLDGGRILTSLLPARSAMALMRLEPYGMLILVGLIVFDPQLHVIHAITGTLVDAVAGTIFSTVLE
ncbi:site-2 protease family protein [Candidatus Nitrospira bockiana]